ncbi:hypothetical protein WDU94_002195, partial [Cyamophila willieti]
KTRCKRQKTRGKRQKTRGKRQKTRGKRQKTRCKRQKTRGKRQKTRCKRQKTRGKRQKPRDKRHKTQTDQDAARKTQIRSILGENTKLKKILMEYKKQAQELEDLRHSDQVRDLDFLNEKRCQEVDFEPLMKDVILKKENLLENIEIKDKEIGRLTELKEELAKENELYRQKIKEAKDFMRDVHADEILATHDRDEIKIVKNELINKEIEFDDLKYKLNQAKVVVQDLKESLEDRQKIMNHYKQKCTQLEEARKKQMESVADMDKQYDQVIDKLNNDFHAFKTKMCSEVQNYLPMVNKIKTILKRLADSDKLLKTARNSYDDMKTENNRLVSKIETLTEDIHALKKRQLTEEQNKHIDKELLVLENDLNVQARNYNELVESNQQIKFDIRQANAKAEEKEKELVQLRLLKQNLKERIAEENQHKISGYESICNTESYLINLKKELEAELQKCDQELRSKIGCSYSKLTKQATARTSKICLLDTKLKIDEIKNCDEIICPQTKSENNFTQDKLEDIKKKMMDVLSKCKTENCLIEQRRNIESAEENLDFLGDFISEECAESICANRYPQQDSEGNLFVSTLEIT